MRLVTSKILGPLALQHGGYDKAGFDLDYRACLYGARIKNQLDGSGQIGHWLGDKDSIGDIHGGQLLSNDRAKRPVPMWRFATPMIIAGGGGGGPGRTQTSNGPTAGASFSGVRTNFSSGSANAGASFSGVRSNFSNGGPNAGINVPLLNQTTPKEPGAGGQQQNPPQGQDAPTGKPKCPEFSGPNTMVPIFDDSFAGDARFHPLVGAVPKRNGKDLWNKMPVGTVGISLVANDERNQIDLFMPTDPRIYAVNRSDCKMGTLVCDLDPDKFEVDDEAMAHLQSAFWVIKKPLGKKFNVLAVQLGPTGCEDTEGGYVIDKPPGGGVANHETIVVGGGADDMDRVLGLLSVNQGGPLDVGTGKCKHKRGEDEDGHAIDSCHITTKALFRRNDEEDGPLDFTIYKRPGADGNVRVPVYLGWRGDVWAWWTTSWFMPVPKDPPTPRPLPGPDPATSEKPVTPGTMQPNQPGSGSGPGSVTTGGALTSNVPGETPVTAPFDTDPGAVTVDPPFTPPSPTPSHPTQEDWDRYIRDGFDPTGVRIRDRQQRLGISPGQIVSDVMNSAANLARTGMNLVAMMAALGLGAAMAYPANYTTGMTDPGIVFKEALSEKSQEKIQSSTPVTAGMSAFGAQGGTKGSGSATQSTGAKGDPWVYNEEPGQGKYPGGTASGGWVIHPPETDLRDAALYGMAPTNVTLSTTYLLVAPGAWFGAGVPELVDGSIKEGYSWGMDSATGDLIFRSHSGLSAPSEAVRFTKSAQNIQWRSGTAFYGIFDHANTADRTYTFPDASGTIPLGTGTAGQVAFWSATNVLTGDVGFEYDSAANKLTITSVSGAQQRWAYDGSIYSELQTDSSGTTTLTNTGSVFQYAQSFAGNLIYSVQNTHATLGGAVLRMRVAAGSTNDPHLQFNASGTPTWCVGMDMSVVGTPFVVSASSALGTSDVMSMTTGGLVSVVLGDFYVTRNQAGAAVIGKIQNTNNASAAAHATLFLVVGGTSGGDARVLYESGGTNWVHGIDNDTVTDDWVLSASASLGTTNVITCKTTGATTVHQWATVGSITGLSTTTGDVSAGVTGSHYWFFDQSAATMYLHGEAAGGVLYFDSSNVQTRDLIFSTGLSNRWIIRTDNTAESGSNAGSNFSLLARDDTGAALFTAMSIVRSTSVTTFAGVIRGPDGSVSAPTYAFTDRPNYGMYLNDASPFQIVFTLGGAAKVSIDTTNNELRVTSSTAIAWAGGGDPTTGAGDVRLIRDGAGNTLALKNGTAAQTFRIYGDATKHGIFQHNASDFVIGTSATGGRLVLQAQSGNSWLVLSTGHLTTVAAGAQDLGDSTNTVRTGYFDTSVRIGTGATPAHILGATDVIWNEQGADINHRWEGDTLPYQMYLNGDATLENIAFFGTAEPNWQTMDRGFFIGDVTTEPTGNPSSGTFLYSNNGGIKTRGSSGGSFAINNTGGIDAVGDGVYLILERTATTSDVYITLTQGGTTHDAVLYFEVDSASVWRYYADNSDSDRLKWGFDSGGGFSDKLALTTGGDLLLGTNTPPSAGSGKVLVFGDNGGNPTMGTNTGGIFAKDVAGTVEMFAIDEGSAANQLTAHNPLTGEWWINTYFFKEKKQKTFHVERFLRDLCEKVPEIKSKIAIEDYWEVKEMEELV